MDIRGDKAYLSASEQRRSGLESPIYIPSCAAVDKLVIETDIVNHLDKIINADLQDALPRDRAEAMSKYDKALARQDIFRKLATHMLMHDMIGVEQIEFIR